MYNNHKLIRQARRERRARRSGFRRPQKLFEIVGRRSLPRISWPRKARVFPLGRLLAFALALSLITVAWWFRGYDYKKVPLVKGPSSLLSQPQNCQDGFSRECLAPFLSSAYFSSSSPQNIISCPPEFPADEVVTTLDRDCQKAFLKYFHRYSPRLGAGVLLDLKNGELLALAEYRHPAENDSPTLPADALLCLQPLFPAASLFKIVTAYGVMRKKKVGRKSVFPFVGRYHTLYKYQLGLGKSRYRYRPHQISLEKAFARSVNPVFGKFGVDLFTGDELVDLAEDFLFNQPLAFDLELPASFLEEPATPFRRAELASGFIKTTMLSPLHAALIAGAPAAGGEVPRPVLIRRVTGENGAELYYRPPPETLLKLDDARACVELKAMMRATVSYGTASKGFRALKRRKIYRKLEIGGKTGSLDMPESGRRCEWFAGFCQAPGDRRLALAVVLVHGEKRTISASYIASQMILEAVED